MAVKKQYLQRGEGKLSLSTGTGLSFIGLSDLLAKKFPGGLGSEAYRCLSARLGSAQSLCLLFDAKRPGA